VADDGLASAGRAIIDRIAYMTLATVDAEGRPWASPVFFATADYRVYYWMSAPGAAHSRNITERPAVGIVVFDSTVAPGTGQAVYLTATAEQVPGTEIDRALAIYPGARDGGSEPLTRADAQAPSPYRLYRAIAGEQSMLCPRDDDGPCTAHGVAHDHRVPVRLDRDPLQFTTA
jgi:Pyridoxamine 5'-phosphate oxidase